MYLLSIYIWEAEDSSQEVFVRAVKFQFDEQLTSLRLTNFLLPKPFNGLLKISYLFISQVDIKTRLWLPSL